MFPAIRVAQRVPASPGAGRGGECARQVPGYLHVTLGFIQGDGDGEPLIAFEPGGLAVTAPQRDEADAVHLENGAAIAVAVERDLHGYAQFAEYRLRIERNRNATHRAIAIELHPDSLARGQLPLLQVRDTASTYTQASRPDASNTAMRVYASARSYSSAVTSSASVSLNTMPATRFPACALRFTFVCRGFCAVPSSNPTSASAFPSSSRPNVASCTAGFWSDPYENTQGIT